MSMAAVGVVEVGMPCYQPAGLHLLADFHGIAPDLLRDAAGLETLLRRAATAAGAHILHGHFHTFGPGAGITGVLLLAESHISIHTWPETGFAAADIFMCGAARPDLALVVLQATLAPASSRVQRIERA